MLEKTMNKLKNKLLDKKRKYFRRKIRTNKIAKTVSNFPRVIINRSNKFIYAQVIDSEGKVIVSINDYSLKWNKTEKAKQVGQNIWKSLVDKKIKNIAFDRNGYLYHWRVKALAEGLREVGIKF